jgi:hypothetical protein
MGVLGLALLLTFDGYWMGPDLARLAIGLDSNNDRLLKRQVEMAMVSLFQRAHNARQFYFGLITLLSEIIYSDTRIGLFNFLEGSVYLAI